MNDNNFYKYKIAVNLTGTHSFFCRTHSFERYVSQGHINLFSKINTVAGQVCLPLESARVISFLEFLFAVFRTEFKVYLHSVNCVYEHVLLFHIDTLRYAAIFYNTSPTHVFTA